MSQIAAAASTSNTPIANSKQVLTANTLPNAKIDASRDEEKAKDPTMLTNEEDVEEEEAESCLICLGEIIDRSVLPRCLHSLFCFDCILKWIGIHRRCPLCSTKIDDYIIHSIRSDQDYIRHYLPRLSTSKAEHVDPSDDLEIDPAQLQADLSQWESRRVRRQLQHRVGARPRRRSTSPHRNIQWGEQRLEQRQKDAIANWDHRLAFRKKIYREGSYCLHIGSNSSTKLLPPPSNSAISASKVLEASVLSFIRRELLAYPMEIDVDFLSRYTINLLKTFECRSNEAIDLMGEFLGSDGAQHFCHELYSFCRFIGEGNVGASGRQRDKVRAFDEWAQYDPTFIRQHTKQKDESLDREMELKRLLLQRRKQMASKSTVAV